MVTKLVKFVRKLYRQFLQYDFLSVRDAAFPIDCNAKCDAKLAFKQWFFTQKCMRLSTMFLRHFICHTWGFHCTKFKKIPTMGSNRIFLFKFKRINTQTLTIHDVIKPDRNFQFYHSLASDVRTYISLQYSTTRYCDYESSVSNDWGV